jgi:phosphate/sulfate permease
MQIISFIARASTHGANDAQVSIGLITPSKVLG